MHYWEKMNIITELSNNIHFLPVVHGSSSFSREIKNHILSEKCDCLAVALPPEFQTSVEEGIDLLPQITLSTQQEEDGGLRLLPVAYSR